jgi:hypothetical protein
MVRDSSFGFRHRAQTQVQIVTRLHSQIFGLVIESLLVGMFLTLSAHESGRGDPNQVLRLFELSTGLMVVGIAVTGFTIHRGIQALSKFEAERKSNPTFSRSQ